MDRTADGAIPTSRRRAPATRASRARSPRARPRGREALAYATFDRLLRALLAARDRRRRPPGRDVRRGPLVEPLEALARILESGAGPLVVIDEIAIPVRLVLAAPPGVAEEAVKEIHSQPPVLRQCARLLSRLDAVPVETHDTAFAARRVAELGGARAAVCSEEAALEAGLVVLEEDVSDVKPNATRFWTVARPSAAEPHRPRAPLLAGARLAAALHDAGAEILMLAGRPGAAVGGFATVPAPALAKAAGLGARAGEALVWLGPAPDHVPAAAPEGRSARDGGAPADRGGDGRVRRGRGTARRHRRALRGRIPRAGDAPRESGRTCGRDGAPRRCLQAAHVAVRVPGTRPRGAALAEGCRRRGRPPDRHGGHGAGAGRARRTRRGRPPDRGPQLPELRPPEGGGRRRAARDAQARLRDDGRGVARRPPSTSSRRAARTSSSASAGSGRSRGRRAGRSTSAASSRRASLTHLPLLADPSHAAGRKELVPGLARAAWGAGVDGLMIEVHDAPESALCDGPQALLPDDLEMLLDEFGLLPGARARSSACGARSTPWTSRSRRSRRGGSSSAGASRRSRRRRAGRSGTRRARRPCARVSPRASGKDATKAAGLADALIALGLEAEGWEEGAIPR